MIYVLTILLDAGLTGLEPFVSGLAEQGPLVSLFAVICWFLWKKLEKKEAEYKEAIEKKEKIFSEQIDKKDKEVSELNEYIRESDKENLQVLMDVNNTLDKVLENQKHSNDMVVKEIENLKEYISLKMLK